LGDRNDISLYRSLKDAGIVEYFYKPLVDNLVQRACTAVLSGEREHHASHTGKLIFVLGMRGGVGATSIAIWAAWHLAEMRHRRALLVDLDLWGGDTALQLDVLPNHALREALEKPDRVDDLFLERGVIHAGPRLDILAALEPLDQFTSLRDDAVLSLLTNVLSQYRYVFVDVPQALAPQLVQALQLPSIILLVSDGSLVSARDVARWRQQIGPDNAERQTLHVVNKAGALGSLPTEAYVRAVGQAPDIIIPYQHEIGVAATLGAKGLTQDGAMERALAPLFKHIAGETASESRSIFSRLFA
jgi:pilus assembly protein CpaE